MKIIELHTANKEAEPSPKAEKSNPASNKQLGVAKLGLEDYNK
jgi:hypothetical protein